MRCRICGSLGCGHLLGTSATGETIIYDPHKVAIRAVTNPCPICKSPDPCEHFCDRCGFKTSICKCPEGPDIPKQPKPVVISRGKPPRAKSVFYTRDDDLSGTCIGCGDTMMVTRISLPDAIRDSIRWISIDCECGMNYQLKPGGLE